MKSTRLPFLRNSNRSPKTGVQQSRKYPLRPGTGMAIALTMGLFTLNGLVPVAQAEEAPVGISVETVERIVAQAPEVPVDLGLDLPLRLIDFIDCTDPDDPHDFFDRGTSRVVEGPAGTYRVTAEHRHAFFSYRWRRGQKDRPHVIVIEYPDDARREIAFLTHESLLTGRSNADWSLETGVYSGNPFPLTNEMQYHTLFFWPADEWPVVMVGNWARTGAPAAASRIWVFEVEGGELPPLAVDDPEPENPRLIGNLYNWVRVAVRGIYGLTDRRTAMEHIVDYHAYLGHNVVSWPVVANNTWGFTAQIPAWDGSGSGNDLTVPIDEFLEVCDRRGMKFIAVFNTGHRFQIGGDGYSEDRKEEYAAAVRLGFEQFVQRYGKHPSLHGIAMDTQDLSPRYGASALDLFRDLWDGDLTGFTDFIHGLDPDLRVYHFLGGPHIHAEFFPESDMLMTRWEDSGGDWDEHIADELRRQWIGWGRDPAELNEAAGLTTILNYQADDHVVFHWYGSQNPRSMIYHDLDASQARADLIDSRAALIWNTFNEAWLGLQAEPDSGFWYRKEWLAPDFNPAAPSGLAGWARAMAHRDRDLILAGAWNRKGGGHEAALRRFARAFRQLPPVELDLLPVEGDTPVLVRTAVWNKRRYLSALNPTPFEAGITLTSGNGEHALQIEPFGLKTVVLEDAAPVVANGRAADEYREWIIARLEDYTRLLESVRSLDPDAAPEAYARHLQQAEALRESGRWRELDHRLGMALTSELTLRERILQPPRIVIPRVAEPPPLNGSLETWPEEAVEIKAGETELAAHMFFPTSWTGPDDLSARVRLAHDGTSLYVGVHVRDDVLTARDSLALHFSPENYRRWAPRSLPYEITIALDLPLEEESVTTEQPDLMMTGTVHRAGDGYVAEVVIGLAGLGIAPGSTIGWSVHITDDDGTADIGSAGWARKQVIVVPHSPTFTYWSDARTCGELVIGK